MLSVCTIACTPLLSEHTYAVINNYEIKWDCKSIENSKIEKDGKLYIKLRLIDCNIDRDGATAFVNEIAYESKAGGKYKGMVIELSSQQESKSETWEIKY